MIPDFIRQNPLAASQVALSLALVVTTAVYTIYTKWQTDEMQQTRETSNQPVLQGSVITHAPTLVMAEFQNTGNAAAHNITASVYFEDIDVEPMEFCLPMFPPGESHQFTVPIDDSEQVQRKREELKSKLEDKNSSGVLTFKFGCESPFGKSYTYENEVNVLNWLENSSSVVNYSEKSKVRQSIEGIESNLDDINQNLK